MVQSTVRWGCLVGALLLPTACGCSRQPAAPGARMVDDLAPPVAAAPAVVVRGQSPTDPPEKDGPPRGEKKISTDETQAPSEGFRFPDDRNGALLARLLTPGRQPMPAERVPGPRPRPVPRSLDYPTPDIPPVATIVPRLPARPGQTLQPRLTLEETLDDLGSAARLGLAPFPEGERTRLPAPDLSRATPLPPLARPLPDRASLDDPTTEASLAEAVMAIVPPRTNPAPFQKPTLPDPFEFRQPVSRPLAATDEDVPATVRTPKP